MKLRINPVALRDLQGIKDYITDELRNPDAAINTLENIVASYTRLLDFPMMGKALMDTVNIPTDYRFIVSGEYLIFYKIEGTFISIYRIFNRRQDFIRILLSDRD